MMNKHLIVNLLLIPLLVFADEYDENDENRYLRRENSLVRPYQGTGMTIPNWDFYGSTLITNFHIRLTPNERSKRGGIFNLNQVWFPFWEAEIEFNVHGTETLFGDGFAFWYVRDPIRPGPVFGANDHFSGLGVFFDTYANQNGAHNHEHPYISAMVNNGTLTYDHDRDGTHTELDGCHVKFRGTVSPTKAFIRYEDDTLSLKFILNNNPVEECFIVKDVILPTGYFIGLSAATGDLYDVHDLISVKFYELHLKPGKSYEHRFSLKPSAQRSAEPREHIHDPSPPMSNLKFFFIVLISIIVVILVIIGVLYFLQKQKESSRKRFY